MERIINKIIVHHTANASRGDQLGTTNAWHKMRAFPLSSLGWYVGYHYVINKQGIVTQTRRDDEVGAHDYGDNYNSIGVCLEGNFNVELPTKEQETALASLLSTLVKRHGLTALDIEPHRIGDDTDCYGTNLADDWASRVYVKHEANLIAKALSCISLQLRDLLRRSNSRRRRSS